MFTLNYWLAVLEAWQDAGAFLFLGGAIAPAVIRNRTATFARKAPLRCFDLNTEHR
jgi:hypothetical protein